MNTYFFVSVFIAIFFSHQYEVTAKPPLHIVNGTTAKEGEFPYMVQLRSSTGYYRCGGSIIASEWILTVAHCAENLVRAATVIYGTTKLYSGGDGTPNTSSAIKHIYLHPNYTYTPLPEPVPQYDIGLLQLTDPISFNEYAQPILLADDNTNIPVHMEGVVSGWGGENRSKDEAPYLQKINLQLLTDDECTKKINDEEDAFNPIHNLCTNDYYNGGCYGDSGSPYVINGIQYGVLSWSLKPCYGVFPTAYSRITNPEYRNWIRSITNV